MTFYMCIYILSHGFDEGNLIRMYILIHGINVLRSVVVHECYQVFKNLLNRSLYQLILKFARLLDDKYNA